MRALRSAVVVGLAAAIAACLTGGDPCCDNDLECAAGTRCFEGRCAPRCDDQTPCDDERVCIEESGVCARELRNEEQDACSYDESER